MKKKILASILSIFALSCFMKPTDVSADLSEHRTWYQYDSRWGSTPLGGSGCTIASHGCKVTATAIQLVASGAVTDPDFDPGVLGRYFNSIGAYDAYGGMGFGVVDGYGGSDFIFVNSGRKVDRKLSPEDILDNLNKGYYNIAGVGYGTYDTGHWMPIFEYDPSTNDFTFHEVGSSSVAGGEPGSTQRFFAYHNSIGKTVNAVHAYSCSAEPFGKLSLETALKDISTEADSVSEHYSTTVLNTHRLSEYTEDEKDALAILTCKSMDEADYQTFKWNMIVSQFTVPYVESIKSTLENNSAWTAFFSDAVHYGTNSYIEATPQAQFDEGSKTAIQDYILQLKEDLTTPLVSQTIDSQQVITVEKDSVSDKLSKNLIEDNIWATFLVSPANPSYETSEEALDILTDFSTDVNIGKIAKSSLNTPDTVHQGKTYGDVLYSIGPGIKSNDEILYAGGDGDYYDYSGPMLSIPDSFRTAMIEDMQSDIGNSYGNHANTGMGYRTFWQASWLGSGATIVDGYWSRTLGQFSEHSAGVATDFTISLNDSSLYGTGSKLRTLTSDAAKEFTWLADNAHKYGFIWRYKIDGSEKSSKGFKTGTIYESWHWRFVGVYHATKFWEKCSSDGVTGYDTNHNYIWEDYYLENIEGKSKYPQSTYEGIHEFLKEEKGNPLTYSQYKLKVGELLNENQTSNTSESVLSSVVDTVSSQLEPSAMLQAYKSLISDNGCYSNIFTKDGDLATVKDLFECDALYIKDTLAIAGSKFVDKTTIKDNQIVEEELDLGVEDTTVIPDEGYESSSTGLINNWWNSLSEYGSYVNGSIQSIWDSVSEGAYTEVVNVPIYLNTDVSSMYNQMFISNACRILGIPTFDVFIEKFGNTNISIDSVGNICLGVTHTVVFPAYANTIFTTLPNEDAGVIGVAKNDKSTSLILDMSQNVDVNDRLSYSEIVAETSSESSDVFLNGFKRLLLKDNWSNFLDVRLGALTNSNILPAIVRIDSENTPLVNKILLSNYAKNFLPVDTDYTLYNALDSYKVGYQEIDLEKYNSEYMLIPKESLFDNSVFIADSPLESDTINLTGTRTLFPSYIFNLSHNSILKSMKSYAIFDAFTSWNTEYSNFDIYYDYVTFNASPQLSLPKTPMSYISNADSGILPTNHTGNISIPIFKNVFLNSDLSNCFERQSMVQSSHNYTGYVNTFNPVSPVLQNYPLEDIVYISYVWNKDYFNRLMFDNLKVSDNNLSSNFYTNSVLNLSNICSTENNNRIVFTRNIDFENILSETETPDGYFVKSNTEIYALDYNLAYTMLAINKNSYGVNLERMRKELTDELDVSLGILDKIWELSTQTGKSLLYMTLTVIQVLHNWLCETGIGNPFNIVKIKAFVETKMYIVATIFGLIVLTGIVISVSHMIRMKIHVKDLITYNVKSILLATVPLLTTLLVIGIVNNISISVLKELSSTSVLNSLEHSKLKSSDDKVDSAFYTFVPDEDRGFYGYTVRLPGQETPVKLYELYNNVSFQTWYDSAGNVMPWYDCDEFIPVHYNLYGESVFYYFYDYLMYQYLGYFSNQSEIGASSFTSMYDIPDLSVDKTTLSTYKNSVSVYHKEFLNASNNLNYLYADNTYALLIHENVPYVKDLLGLSNLFNMTQTNSNNVTPHSSLIELEGNVGKWSEKVYNEYMSQEFFTEYGNNRVETFYPLSVIMQGKQGDLFYNVHSFAQRTFAIPQSVTFSPYYMKDYFIDCYKDFSTINTNRIPWRVYASEGLLLSHLKGEAYEVSPLEEKLIKINEKFYDFTQAVNMENVTDDTMIFALALEATFLFNSELDNMFDKILEPKCLDTSGTSSDTIMRAIYLNDFQYTGHNFTYSIYETYDNNVLMAIMVLLEEIFLFLSSACKILLFILLFVSSLKFIFNVFKYPSEIKDMIKGLLKQIILLIFNHGFTMFILLMSFKLLRSDVNGVISFIIASTSTIVFVVLTQWSFIQVLSIVMSFKDFGDRYISRRLTELKGTLAFVMQSASTGAMNFQKTLIHKSPDISQSIEKQLSRDNLLEQEMLVTGKHIERRVNRRGRKS